MIAYVFVYCHQSQRKYELEIENRRSIERNLEEVQRLLDNERQMKNQMGVTNREWTDKITILERQVNSSLVPHSSHRMCFSSSQLNEANEKLKLELDTNIRLKKQHQDIQKTSTQLERSYADLQDKYQELIGIKLKFEKDVITQQGNLEQEKSAKYMALDKIQELEGKCNAMTIELAKCKERDGLQTNELIDLRQSNAFFERVGFHS